MNLLYLADSGNWLYDQLGVAIMAIGAVGALWKYILTKEKALEKEREAWQAKYETLVENNRKEMQDVYLRMADSEKANLETLRDVISCMSSVSTGQIQTQSDVLAIKDLVLEKVDDLKTMIINGSPKK